MNMDRRYMIKRFVGEIQGQFCQFRVFSTGDDRYLLFAALDPQGCDHGVHFPVLRSRLTKEARHKLYGP